MNHRYCTVYIHYTVYTYYLSSVIMDYNGYISTFKTIQPLNRV